MNLSDFEFDLPADRIAQAPLPERDASKLLVLDRRSGEIAHHAFRDLPDLLDPTDLVVVNDTRVIPARLSGWKEKTGGRVEILLVREREEGLWDCMAKGTGRLRPDTALAFEDGVRGVVETRPDADGVRVRFSPKAGFREWVGRRGRVPLPPYIRRPETPEDRECYQTVFAENAGAIAAPTAGLHFTPELLKRLEARGIGRAALTLHVGPGTFRPIRAARVEDHVMDAEETHIPPETARKILETRAGGGRIVAVGTTVVRTLEGRVEASPRGEISLRPGRAAVSLFITPGHRLRLVGGLVTNFHLSGSTLLLLVAAFAGRERILEAYDEALRKGYRFYSYGDAMWIR